MLIVDIKQNFVHFGEMEIFIEFRMFLLEGGEDPLEMGKENATVIFLRKGNLDGGKGCSSVHYGGLCFFLHLNFE